MGWASGKELAEDIWKLVRPYLTQKEEKRVANHLIKLFEAFDCDTIGECTDLCKAAGVLPDEDKF